MTDTSTTLDPARDSRVKVLPLIVTAAAALMLWTPAIDGGGAIADGGSAPALYVLGLAGLALVGAFVVSNSAVGWALIAGAVVPLVGYAALMASLMRILTDDTGLQAGPALLFAVALLVVGAVTLVKGLARSNDDDTRRIEAASAPLGAIAAVGTTVGLMMPEPDSGLGFSEKNFDVEPGLLQAGWLVFVASFAVAGVVGFLRRNRAGLALAFGGFAAGALLWLTMLIDDPANRFASAVSEVHPLFPIALAVQLLALLIGRSALAQRASAPVDGPSIDGPPVAASPVSSPPLASAAPSGRWGPDPFGRATSRYHDGTRWTHHVASQGVTSTDAPVHPAPHEPPAAAWAPDPFGRHRTRYFDGKQWTEHVSDGSGESRADPPQYPPPTA